MAILQVTKELTWLKTFIGEFGKNQVDCVLFSNSQSATHLEKNLMIHIRTKLYSYIAEVSFHQGVDGRSYVIAKKCARIKQSIRYADEGGDLREIEAMCSFNQFCR